MSSPGRGRFAAGCAAGGVLATGVFTWLVTGGRADLLRRETFANFYDAQAKALLAGHWNVPATELYIEGFHLGDKTYTYFGIWPSVLRMPVLAVSDAWYGRMSALSMILAFAVALVGISMLQWRVARLLRPSRTATTRDAVLAGVVVFAAGCGSTALFLGSRAWVYHEAILWGLAFVTRPSGARLAATSAAAALAFLSRPSVGIGPVVALGLVLAGQLVREVARRFPERLPRVWPRLRWLGIRPGETDDEPATGWVVPIVVALAVPCALYAWMNWSRFGTVFSVPWSKQLLVTLDARHRAALGANGGTYFGLKFLPTTLLQYMRPDALGSSGLYPWLTFPRFHPPVIGSAVFDTIDVSTSVPASMPVLTVLGAIGVWAAAFPKRMRAPRLVALRVPLLGAAAAVGFVLALSFIANRYLGDWVPFLVLAAVAGLEIVRSGRDEDDARPRRARRSRRTVAFVALGVLAAWGVWVNFSLGVLYQRLYNPPLYTWRAPMLGFQHHVDDLVGGRPRDVVRSDTLPDEPARADTAHVIGDCDAVYWSSGDRWWAVEGRPAGGWFRLRGAVPSRSGWQPLVSVGRGAGQQVVGVRRVGSRIQVGLGLPHTDGRLGWIPSVPVKAGAGDVVVVHVDRPLRELTVLVGDTLVTNLDRVAYPDDTTITVGRAESVGVARTFAGPLRELPPKLSVCPEL